ncbi:MAG: hypothetical protein M0Z56_11530, partial [Desulfobacteraceae bacterium]|nr:hypothetical protein [Desulfobacteraceae bacterium]
MNQNSIRVRLAVTICLFLCFSEAMAHAEGSRSLYPATYPGTGSRANLDYQTGQRYLNRVNRVGFNYVYAQAGEYILLGSSNCAVPANSQAWSLVRGVLNNPPNTAYIVNPGSNRLLVVAVSSRLSAAGTQTPTVTYGGQALTLQVGDGGTSSVQHSYLFYLNDARIAAAVGTNLVFTGLGGAATYNHVYAAVYTGVDQSGPISDSRNYNSAAADTAVGPFAPPPGLTIGTDNLAVEIVNITRNDATATARTITTWAAGWTGAGGGPNSFNTVPAVSAYVRTNSTVGTTTSQHTASGDCWDSMSAMSLRGALTNSGEIYVFNP